MTKRMLIDAAHSEEVRVVIMENDRIEEFEVESSSKEQIRGNIYVAEIQRVEPSLQACFVDYGGNRNGFLAFSEIHPQYFDLTEDEKKELMKELEEISQRRSAPRPNGPRRHARGGARPTEDTATDGDDITEGNQPMSAESAAELEEENLEAAQSEATETVEATTKADKKADGRRRPRRASRTQSAATADAEDEASATTDAVTDAEAAEDAAAAAAAAKVADSAARPAHGELTDEELEEDARALALANSMVVKQLSDDDIPPALQGESKGRNNDRGRRGRDRDRGRGRGRGRDDRRNNRDAAPADETAKPTEDAAPAERSNASESTAPARRQQPIHRRYNIADVLKRGQKVLVQVVKEERGTKGAALTTFISLPGRFTVLMPNTPYAGGISRKITDLDERRQLKNITEALNVPEGMGLIVRTAGLGQSQDNITQDLKHLLSHWERISAFWQTEAARTCVHEDGSLIIRALRDMFSDDISEITVSGAKAFKACRDYMKAILPDHAKVLKEHKGDIPLFSEHGVEMELHHMNRTRVNLPSGGYLIINPTEALVSIDVNSGRATGEKNIEETALKTNLEAAEELGRQLRLRDLAGLIVVDFIDMDDRRNERAVERAMRDAVKRDRARIQIGHISDFGLLEMSRQRMRPSLGETSFVTCPHCHGSGLVRSPASSALMILRGLEEEDIAGKADRVIITTSHEVAVYMLNYKRDMIAEMERRYKTRIIVIGDGTFVAPDHRLELVRVEADGTEKKTTHENRWRELSAEEEQAQSKRRRRRRGGRKGRDDERQERSERPQQQADGEGREGRDSREGREGRDGKNRRDRRGRGRDRDRNRNRDQNQEHEQQQEAAVAAQADAAEAQTADADAPGDDTAGGDRRRPRRTQLGRRRGRRDGSDTRAGENGTSDQSAPVVAQEKAAEAQAPVAKPAAKAVRKPTENKPVERVVVEAAPDEKAPAKRGRAKKATGEKMVVKPRSTTNKTTENKPLMVERIGGDGASVAAEETAKKSVFQRWWSK
ncbi:MAG: Rne/Rng family ribonuclease [Proteobacteria bacterium]|nr:Rne/Rng family ribonuclease [Pseudomonadota bacterium]